MKAILFLSILFSITGLTQDVETKETEKPSVDQEIVDAYKNVKNHININETYPICGKYDEIKKYHPETNKVIGSIVSCFATASHYDGTNFGMYKAMFIKDEKVYFLGTFGEKKNIFMLRKIKFQHQSFSSTKEKTF